MRDNQSAEMGMNKTGTATAPRLTEEMIQSANNGPVTQTHLTPEAMRKQYIERGETIGSVPPPLSMKGMAKSAFHALKGEKATVFIDKLAERLAFERSGTRLYEALMLKCPAGEDDDSETMPKLEEIWREELAHFHMLWDCIEQLGADPTVQTPSADLAAVASQGIPKVLLDPRTTFTQCLEAIMMAEVVDYDAWDRLVELADRFGQNEMAEKFRHALEQEKNHLVTIREMLAQEVTGEAGVNLH